MRQVSLQLHCVRRKFTPAVNPSPVTRAIGNFRKLRVEIMAEDDSSSPLVGAIDQGTSSSRFLIFSGRTGKLLAFNQIEVAQVYPDDGWVEMCGDEMLATTERCIEAACEQLSAKGMSAAQVKTVGITNQRETSLIWSRSTGKPFHPAIVWLDARTAALADQLSARTPTNSKEHWRDICGLPIHPYFSALKIRWMIDNVPSIRKAVESGDAMAGTVDAWLIWKLTGDVFATDVTNASRTMLMNLRTADWDDTLCNFFDIPKTILPEIKSSAEHYGSIKSGVLAGVPISGVLGDQQAAMVGHMCLDAGQAKNTYGTGTFMLFNTGTTAPTISSHGLLTTVAFRLGPQQPIYYALEGAGSIGGTAVRWLRDKLGLIKSAAEVEDLAKTEKDNGGVYFVPSFSGLYTPYWDPSARGTICGLTQHSTKGHLARATLEAVCFQTSEMIEAVGKDSKQVLKQLKVDGGMTDNRLLMQNQADLLGVEVCRPHLAEVTAWGAAVAAGLAEGVWTLDWHRRQHIPADLFTPTKTPQTTTANKERMCKWKQAIDNARGWAT